MLKLRDVFIVFNSGTAQEKVALRGINFELDSNEIVTVVGNAGSGKSTLLKFLAGHIVPSFGKVWIDHQDITFQSLGQRSQKFAFVSYERDGAASNLTVAENLAIASMHHQKRSIFASAIDEETHELYYNQLKELDFFAMETVLDERVYNISHLHRFVLSLLIAVMKNAEVLLIDEHISGVTKKEEEALTEVTRKIVKSQKSTALIAMGDPTHALEFADRTIVLSYGQIVADLSGETKKKTRVEDLFASFKIVPKIKDVKPSGL